MRFFVRFVEVRTTVLNNKKWGKSELTVPFNITVDDPLLSSITLQGIRKIEFYATLLLNFFNMSSNFQI